MNIEQHTAAAIKRERLISIEPPTYGPDHSNHVQNVEIFIGNSPVFHENPRCPTGPFMVPDDPGSYTETEKY